MNQKVLKQTVRVYDSQISQAHFHFISYNTASLSSVRFKVAWFYLVIL